MTSSGWLRLPAAILRRLVKSEPERPWFVPASVGWLKRRISRDWSVLELGSGRSTVWLARRAGSVISFENDLLWLNRAQAALEAAKLDNAELRHLPVEQFADAVARFPNDSFDLVIVDFLETPRVSRVEAVRPGRSKVKPGGYLLLDDSDRPHYAEAHELLSGWDERRFVGIKERWFQAVETSIFKRPVLKN